MHTLRVRLIAGGVGMSAVLAAAAGSPFTFNVHTINAESKYEAAAIADMDGDGKPDIYCGGFWYQAPDWKRHVVRAIEEVNGYYLDLSAIPADVNGDGRIDVVGSAWHNKSLFWMRNPGVAGEPWAVLPIDTPGNAETLIPADFNGDGRPDILPNLVRPPAAWYSFDVDPAAENGARWTRHDLPPEAGNHGIGVGDINGDGRPDLVTPIGWIENTPSGWVVHAEWKISRSVSIPMLVTDVDGDGLADVIWGSAHDYGVHWMRQGRDAAGARTWTRADIDMSWSQAHFLLLADLNNDGQSEVVTGKRYYAHNGRDPGAEDPIAIYAYQFDRAAGVWVRHALSEGARVGFGLSTMAADIDGDGDIDLLCPGKSGLYLLENLLISTD